MSDDAQDQGSGTATTAPEAPGTTTAGSVGSDAAGRSRWNVSNPARVRLSIIGVGLSVAALLVWQAFHNEPRLLPGVDGVTTTVMVDRSVGSTTTLP